MIPILSAAGRSALVNTGTTIAANTVSRIPFVVIVVKNAMAKAPVVIFKASAYGCAKNTQIQYNITGTDPFLPFAVAFIAFQTNSTQKTAKRGQRNQQKKTPIPPAIKHITCYPDK